MDSVDSIGLPLSMAQSAVWIASQITPDCPVYNVGEYIEILGAVDVCCFEMALRQVVREVDAFRIKLVDDEGGLVQEVIDDASWNFRILDASTQDDPWAAGREWMRSDMMKPIDLAGPLSTHWLLRLSPDRFIWYYKYHHIIMDLYGCALIVNRVAEIYTALDAGRPPPPPRFDSIRILLDNDQK